MMRCVAAAAVLLSLASSAEARPRKKPKDKDKDKDSESIRDKDRDKDRDKARADALFKEGRQLLNDKSYDAACEAFDQSQQLDPQIGTVLNLALCYEAWGKLAKAQRAYLEAEKLSAIKGDQRATVARQRADALAPRIPKLAFADLPETLPADLVLTLDGDRIGVDAIKLGLSTDPGAHSIEYTVADQKKREVGVTLIESETKWIKLDLPAPMPIVVDDNRGPPPPPRRGRSRRILAVATAGTGLATIAAGGVLGLLARSDYNNAFRDHCDSMNICDDVGYQLTTDARSRANIGTVLVGVGTAAVIAGVVLWVTAPSGPAVERRAWIRPVVTHDGAAVVIGGPL